MDSVKTSAKKYHYLFTGDEHEGTRLNYTHDCIANFIKYWELGWSMELMTKKLRLNDSEFALIVMDLHISDKISNRARGWQGTVRELEKVVK